MGLIAELKRRNVFRVAIAYAVMAWLLAQIADLAFDNFGAPEWVPKSFLFFLVLGFPIAVFFAWAFELTPEGLKLEKEVDRSESITHKTGRKLDFIIIGMLVLGVGFLVVDRFRIQDEAAQQVADASAEAAGEVTTTELERSIAVLPFENRSNREEDQFFTDGIHDDLLTTIANIGDLRVISRTSVMQYRGEITKTMGEIAAELNVATILEGGVQRSGDHVRINVQLIDAATDAHVWAEIYDRELTAENLFSIQSEVSNAIAAALHATLSPEEQERVSSVGTTSLEAYQEYMLGRERWYERTGPAINAAVEHFLNAVELDPDYAEAWAGLSDAYRLQTSYSGVPRSEAYPKAEHAVERALELDANLAEALAAKGGLLRDAGDFDGAVALYERAIELNPTYSYTYGWYALLVEALGDPWRALEIVKAGIEVDPLNLVLNSNLSGNMHLTGDWEAVRAQSERLIEIAPDSSFGYNDIATHHLFVDGRADLAVEWYQKALDADPTAINSYSSLLFCYQLMGDLDKASVVLERVREMAPESPFVYEALHTQALRTGDIESARRYARLAVAGDRMYGLFFSSALTVLAEDIENGDIDSALGRYRTRAPELFEPETADFGWDSMWFGPQVAYLLKLQGNDAEARVIVEKTLAESENYPAIGWWGYNWARAHAYAVIGDSDNALREIEDLMEANATPGMWYVFDHLVGVETLRDDLRFQAMREQFAARMAEQLENVQRQSGAFEW